MLDDQLITVAVDRLHAVPRRHRRRQRRRRSPAASRSSSAQDLANELQPARCRSSSKLISQSQVSATLGKQALNQGLIAGLVGFARRVPVPARLLPRARRDRGRRPGRSTAIYFFALIKLIPITLTLPGIAGLILTIGVAADANIVIFERVKEEIRGGRSIRRASPPATSKGFAAIVDANVVTFMTAFILFVLATAGVKGFAFTLGIGTLVSLFTAVLATQAIARRDGPLAADRAPGGARRRRQAQRSWTFDFMGASKWFFSMSGMILLIGALAIGGKGLNFGIDFKSGTRITDGAAPSRPARARSRDALDAARRRRRGGPEGHRTRRSARNGFQISTKKLQPGRRRQGRDGARARRFGVADDDFDIDLDRADLRQDGRQQRGDRDHRLAAGDLAPTSRCASSGSTRCRC